MLTDYKKKANPTEYRGIRFDSKSEAIFARLLDVSGCRWEHMHPISTFGHDWDFLVWSSCRFNVGVGDYVFHRPSYTVPCLVELKPSIPTESYLENLASQYNEEVQFVVVYGNPYQPSWFLNSTGIYYEALIFRKGVWCNAPIWQVLTGFLQDEVPNARDFRFDLKEYCLNSLERSNKDERVGEYADGRFCGRAEARQ